MIWLYAAIKRLTVKQMADLPHVKKCLLCEGRLGRLAERQLVFPYVWVPTGWICTMCNTCYMGVQ